MALSKAASLRSDCLSFPEILAQGIALIAPTMTAALIIPLTFSNAGTGTWLTYVFATIMLLFVAFNLNQFASRSTSAGSMYLYTGRGLGPLGSALSGWCLVWAYLFIGTAGLTGFSISADQLFGLVGLHIPSAVLFAICAGAAWFCAYKDVQLSSVLMMILEGLSVALILLLAIVVLFHVGVVDQAQLSLQGASFSGLSLGVVVCIFSLVGFEAPTAFGEEAKNPLKTIPRAVIGSLLITGLFFVIVSYAEVAGLGHQTPGLDKATAPLNDLADLMRLGILKAPISLGAMTSFFSLALSCLSAGSRILYPMGQHGLFHTALGKAHPRNRTPHVAVNFLAAVMVAVPTLMTLFGIAVADAFGYVGTLGAFGFLAAYFLISIAAPVYLYRKGWLRPGHVFLSVAAVLFLLVPTIGSVYPIPSYPINLLPYLFLGYFAIGAAWFSHCSAAVPELWQSFAKTLKLPVKYLLSMPLPIGSGLLRRSTGSMTEAEFHGIIAYPITPFKMNGDVDTDLLAVLIDQLIATGAHAIAPLGSTGESAYLGEAEWQTVAEVSLQQVARRVPTIVGISDFTTQVAVQRARFAERLGADAVMVLPMSYWKLSEREIFQHYGAIAAAISLPMMVYNNPATSGIDLSPELIVQMAKEIPNVTMVKESTGDLQRLHQLQALSAGTLPFYNGSNPLALAAFAAGASGWCTAAHHLIPELTLALYHATSTGDLVRAQQVFDQQLPLLQFLVRSHLPATVKAGLKLLGIDVGVPRPPLLPLEATAIEHLEQLLNQVRTVQSVT